MGAALERSAGQPYKGEEMRNMLAEEGERERPVLDPEVYLEAIGYFK